MGVDSVARSADGHESRMFALIQCIVVRNVQEDQDRITFLPKPAVDELKRQIGIAKQTHQNDLEAGYDRGSRRPIDARGASARRKSWRVSVASTSWTNHARLNQREFLIGRLVCVELLHA